MHLASRSVAMAARQLLVPTFAAPMELSATGTVDILPVPALETEPPLIFGPGPVIISFETAVARVERTESQFTLGHGPVVVSEPTPTTSTTSTTLATVVETSSVNVPRSNSVRAVLPSRTHSSLLEVLPLDCHDDSNGYIYFTIISTDGSPVLDFKGEKALHYIKTQWRLSYPEILRQALFNDPEASPTCPYGYCRSELIPGTDLYLEYVRNPRVFRVDWYQGQCGYLDGIQHFSKLAVSLGNYGYLFTGAVPQVPIIDFVEQQISKTYPVLEISLIAGFTAGLLSLFIVFVPVATYGYFMMCDWYRGFSSTTEKLATGTKRVSRRTVDAIPDGMERCKTKVQETFRSTYREDYVPAHGDTYSDPESIIIPGLTVPPPAYTPAMPTRVFVTLELEHSCEHSGRPC